jgi:DNA-binding response OmpR family regulator
MKVFSALLAKPDWYLNREELSSARSSVTRAKKDCSPHAIEQYVRRIRKKVREVTGYTLIITTEYNTGYRLNRHWYNLEFDKRNAGP